MSQRHLNGSILRYVVGCLVLSVIGCGQHSGRWQPRDEDRRAAAESARAEAAADTVYQRRLADLVRRSLLVRTDSVARLYASIPATPDSSLHRLRQEIGCAHMRGLVEHGQAAQLRAFRRMKDSLERSGFDFSRHADRMLAARGPPLQFGVDNCGVDVRRGRVADSLNREVYPTRRGGRPR